MSNIIKIITLLTLLLVCVPTESYAQDKGTRKERKMERKLILDYEKMIRRILSELKPENHETAIEMANLPDMIRGFGHVKEGNVEAAKLKEAELREKFFNPDTAAAHEEAA